MRIILIATVVLAVLVTIALVVGLRLRSEAQTQRQIRPDDVITAVSDQKVLQFASDPWPPYAGTAGAEQEGYIVDVLRLIYGKHGYEVEFVNKPWTRCIDEVRRGELTALAGADIDEVPDFVFPRQIIGITEPTFFVRPDSQWRFSNLDSLKGIKLGVIQDYTYEEHLDDYVTVHRDDDSVFVATGNDPLRRLVEALLAKRIDVFVENRPVVPSSLREWKMDPAVVREAGSPGQGVKLFIPFSPANPASRQLADLFDKELALLRDNGRLAEVLQPYGIQDWASQP